MQEYTSSIGIMFPSSWPEDHPDAHCTLIYLGDMADARFTKEDLQTVVNRLKVKAPGDIKVTGVDLFGPEKNVLVAVLDPTYLLPIRQSYERALAKINVFNASQFKTYQPHVTITEEFGGTMQNAIEDTVLPKTVNLGEPQLWWGNEH